ncbi:flagellar filament capping protein FliD [Roseovarius gahaiensis]|uniref:Flagellar hook-associated protein 2 n=1 Tax=Roseovarius gahaiensis TaxID=2716691 RepID=A0A967BHY2_9RHOB|nr:flagellar filament capping protein FliD [Roseovarius gahaiensis]NHQ75553.1 flagellar filament capping protein FliD [Roseovarius gahaiensis]
MDILSSLNTGGSGLNISELTETLTKAEIEPRKSLITQRIDTAELRLSGYERVRGQTETLNEMLDVMRQASPLAVRSDTSGVQVSVTDPDALDLKSAQIAVDRLATSQVLNFAGYASADAEVGQGSLTVAMGNWSEDTPPVFTPGTATAQTITFAPGSTLADVAEELSLLDGVSARVIDSGNGTFSLGVISQTGAANALRFSTDAGSDPGLATLDFAADPAAVQVQAAGNAELSLNGIPVTRSSNEVSDLLPGVDISLTAPTTTPASITATPDTEGSLEVMQGFVDMINATRSLFSDLTERGFGEADTAGDLAGDILTESVMLGIETVLARGFGSTNTHLADIGVMTERDGSLSLNAAKFTEALTENPLLLNPLIRDDLTASAPSVQVGGAPAGSPETGAVTLTRDPATGAASLDGVALIGQAQDDGTWLYSVNSGPMRGITLTAAADTTAAEIAFRPSMLSSLQSYLSDTIDNGTLLEQRETTLKETIADESSALEALDTRSEDLRARYLSRFTEMERIITQLNSTGDYLTNLIDGWNSDN